jgi:intracellular multiplication protein IcmL
MTDAAKDQDNQVVEGMILEVLSRLKKTSIAVDPAVQHQVHRGKLADFAGISAKMNIIVAAALFLSIILNCVLGWFAVHPVREYFASDNGRLFPMVPLSAPYQKPANVIQFAKDTLSRAFTLDFLNWRQQLEDSRARYTKTGFRSYLDALKSSGVLEIVQKRRMNMTVTAGTGVLVKEGIENGVYVWLVEVPIEVKLTGQTSELPSQKFRATVRIERIPTLDSIEGIGTAQLITRPQ